MLSLSPVPGTKLLNPCKFLSDRSVFFFTHKKSLLSPLEFILMKPGALRLPLNGLGHQKDLEIRGLELSAIPTDSRMRRGSCRLRSMKTFE